MADVGVMPPPQGVIPDFYSWTYLQHTVIAVFAVTFLLATTFLALRLYTSIVLVKKLDWDVLLIVLAWGTSLTFFIGMVLAMPSGFGRHLWDVTPTQLLGYFDLLLLLAITYIWPSTLTKLAMLILYLRVNPSKVFQASTYIIGICVVAYTVVFTVLFAGPCNPTAVGSGNCLNNIAVSQAILNIVSDAVMIILPIPMIHRLKMPLKQKMVIGVLMGLGSAVVIASIARVAYVRAMVENPDVTWTQAEAAVFSSLELNLGIICNSMARLKPFVKTHFPRWAGSFGNSSAHAGEYSRSKRNKTNNGYQLGSVERAERFAAAAGQHKGNDIHVIQEYQVDFEGRARSRENPETASTENILEPEQDNRHVL
ncbi:hypothetical protein B7463_g3570, partial [Scytalidium lignicola]